MGQDPPVSPGEYRIIPVDKPAKGGEDDAVDLSALFMGFRERRRLIFVIVTVCLGLGILYALLTPIEFKSEAMVMPEAGSSQGEFSDLIKNYGGLLGLGSSGSVDLSKSKSISPQVYPVIVRSLAFQQQMLTDTVYFANSGQSLTLYGYFKDRVGTFYSDWFSHSDYEKKMSKLPYRLRQQLNEQQMSSVSPKQLEVIKALRERINIQFDTGTGVMRVSAQIPDAVAAAQVCSYAIVRLTDYVKKYRTQKAKAVLDFTNDQYQTANKKFKTAQRQLAHFQDQNLNLNTAKAQTQEKYLQSKYNLAYNMFSSISEKRIQARMVLQKNKPVFTTLQPAEVPLERDQPRWISIIIFSLMTGVILSFLLVSGLYLYQTKWSRA